MSPGRRPSLRQAIRYGADVPKYVSPSSWAIRHRKPRSGWAGDPSYSTIVASTARPDTR